MYSNAAIQIVVEDDAFNAPDAKKIARTIIVKMPRGSSYARMFQIIAEQYPAIINRVLTLYYFGRNGLKTTINEDNVAEFWRHQSKILDGPCVLTLNAIMLRLPKKNCDGCAGGLFGRFHACRSCDYHLCLSCVASTCTDTGCPAHGTEFLAEKLVPIPQDILDQKNREYSHEKHQHQRYWERRRTCLLAINLSRANY